MFALLKELDKIDKSNLEPDEKKFLQICYESFRLRFYLYSKQFWRAYEQTKIMNQLISTTLGKESDYNPYYLTSGLFNYFAFTGRKKYPFLFTDNLYKNSSREKGIKYLELASNSDNFMIKTEALYFLVKIYLEVEDKPDLALKYSSQLIGEYNSNIIFQYYHLNILLNLKQNLQAKHEYNNILELIKSEDLSGKQKSHLKDIVDKVYKQTNF